MKKKSLKIDSLKIKLLRNNFRIFEETKNTKHQKKQNKFMLFWANTQFIEYNNQVAYQSYLRREGIKIQTYVNPTKFLLIRDQKRKEGENTNFQ